MAGWWAETFANITAQLQAVRASLSGEQPSSGVFTATLRRVTAAFVGVQPFQGTIAATVRSARAALSGDMPAQGVLAAQLQAALFAGSVTPTGTVAGRVAAARAALAGAQAQSGVLAAQAQPARAALAGGQTQSGVLSAQVKAATALFSGWQAPQGTLAAQAKAAVAAMTGSVSTPAVTFVGATQAGPATSVSLAGLGIQVGDIIVMFVARYNSNSLPSKPAAGGTVPTWVDINVTTASLGSSARAAYAVATATNHTSGTWSSATDFAVIVLRGQDATTPIGGQSKSFGNAVSAANAPSITLDRTDGTSAIVVAYFSDWAQSWGAAPTGYTRRAAENNVTSGGVCLNTKDDTTSDGSSSQAVNTSGNNGDNIGITIEIRAH